MTSVVWAVIVFGLRVWPLSARRHDDKAREKNDNQKIASNHTIIGTF